MHTTRGALIAVSLSTVTAVAGIATGIVLWSLRRMQVGSVGRDRERYDVYYDLMRQADALAYESAAGR